VGMEYRGPNKDRSGNHEEELPTTIPTNVVIQSLAFLGTVFYPAQMLPPASNSATPQTSNLKPHPALTVVLFLATLSFNGPGGRPTGRSSNLRY
jgi:hypothetical protein